MKWDADNRLIQIDYPGANNYSQFSYDGLGRNSKIVETTAGSVTSTKQFVWSASRRAEERDASSGVTSRFFDSGQTISGTSYFYAKSHPGSVTELTDGSGAVQAQYAFDPFGRSTKLQGSLDSDFQYAGYYMHQRSGLNLTVFRAYNSRMGRWISRDPVEEEMGSNLFAYVLNAPVAWTDSLGLARCCNPPPEPNTKGMSKFLDLFFFCSWRCRPCMDSSNTVANGGGQSKYILNSAELRKAEFQKCVLKCIKDHQGGGSGSSSGGTGNNGSGSSGGTDGGSGPTDFEPPVYHDYPERFPWNQYE